VAVDGKVLVMAADTQADLHFYFDPICPFAWITSKWVRRVAALRSYTVDWRFISLRLVNANMDYAAQFPADYEAGHNSGLHLLRVAARTRAEHGREAVGRYYEELGNQMWEGEKRVTGPAAAAPESLASVLTAAELPDSLAGALGEEEWDAEIGAETDEALALTGKDVGTPILHFTPPDGTALFGPVISRLPSDEEALELWDHVIALSNFPGFAELKRSLRERIQLPAFGVPADKSGAKEDWHGGSRRLKK
jgi:2-hydroxychromene-2-carboxylate isomerase